MPGAGFDGLRVLALESRHAKEISKLIASYGGQPTVAPAMREVSLKSPETLEFAAGLMAGTALVATALGSLSAGAEANTSHT